MLVKLRNCRARRWLRTDFTVIKPKIVSSNFWCTVNSKILLTYDMTIAYSYSEMHLFGIHHRNDIINILHFVHDDGMTWLAKNALIVTKLAKRIPNPSPPQIDNFSQSHLTAGLVNNRILTNVRPKLGFLNLAPSIRQLCNTDIEPH